MIARYRINIHFCIVPLVLVCLTILPGCSANFNPLRAARVHAWNSSVNSIITSLNTAAKVNSGIFATYAEPVPGQPVSFDQFAESLAVTSTEHLSDFITSMPSNPWNPAVKFVVIDGHDDDSADDDPVAMDQTVERNLPGTIMYETGTFNHHIRITYWLGGTKDANAIYVYDSDSAEQDF